MALIADFQTKFPMDERALNYFLQSSAEVKQRVLSEFRPSTGVDGDYSKAVTAFVRRCREDEKIRGPGGSGHGGTALGGASSSTNALVDLLSQIGKTSGGSAAGLIQQALATVAQASEQSAAKRQKIDLGLGPKKIPGGPTLYQWSSTK